MLVLSGIDEERAALREALRARGCAVSEAGSVAGGLRALVSERVEGLVAEVRAGGEDAGAVFTACTRLRPRVAALALVRPGEPEPPAAAVLLRPVAPAEVAERLVRLLLPPAAKFPVMAAGSELMPTLDAALRYAATDAPILITGETGSGKEVIARFIHASSPRSAGPFVPVNCAAIPEGLLESELFGHEKGAFTGAARARAGRFALAEGGTIFLDEVGELPLALQPKLLRVLQDHSFEPLGSGRARQADFRLIAATHRNLETLVAGGQFREDLYYRLAVLPVHVPALRERPGDVPALGRHFLWRAAERMGVEVRPLGPEAEAALCGEPWPGNVRQLENAMERLAVLCSSRAQPQCGSCPGRIVAECIPGARGTRPPPGAPPALPESGVDLNLALREMEARLIREALQRTAGNKERAAKLLGLNRTTLVEKIKRSALAPAAPIPRGPSKI